MTTEHQLGHECDRQTMTKDKKLSPSPTACKPSFLKPSLLSQLAVATTLTYSTSLNPFPSHHNPHSFLTTPPLCLLQRARPRKQARINRIHNRLRANLPPTKESPIQTLDRILPTLYFVEFQINVTLCVRV